MSKQLEQNLFSSRSFGQVSSSETQWQSVGSAEKDVTKVLKSTPFLPNRLTAPGSPKMPALLACQVYVQFDVWLACQREQRSKQSSLLISIVSEKPSFKMSPFIRIRAFFKPRIFLVGFAWTSLNKPLELESGCKKETSAEIPYWWRVTTQICVVLLIGWTTNFPRGTTNQKHYPKSG